MVIIKASVTDQDPPGSEIIWFQGSGSGSEIIHFGSGSSFFHNKLRNIILKCTKSEQIHHPFIGFQPICVLIFTKIDIFSSPYQAAEGSGSEISDFQMEDPDQNY